MKMVDIVHDETGQAHRVPESAYLKVWSSRGYRLRADVEAENAAKRKELEDQAGESGEDAAVEANAGTPPAAATTASKTAPKPQVGETATGDSKQGQTAPNA